MKPRPPFQSLPNAMKPSTRSVLSAVLLAAAILIFAVRHIAPALPPFVGPPDFQESRSLGFPAAAHVVVMNEDGAVRIETSADGGVQVEADIRLYGGTEVGDETLAAYASELVEATFQGGRLEIVTEPRARVAGVDLAVAYVITVPEGTDIDVIGANGNVSIAEGCGKVAVYGGNSDIEIVRPRGIVIAKSENGRIKLVEGRDDANLEAVNGNIYADMYDGRLKAHTVNGLVIARLLDRSVDYCETVSANGSITIELAFDGFEVDLHTDRGFIRSDFALGNDLDPGVLDVKTAKGESGGGGAMLMAEALSGNIWLKRNAQWQ